MVQCQRKGFSSKCQVSYYISNIYLLCNASGSVYYLNDADLENSLRAAMYRIQDYVRLITVVLGTVPFHASTKAVLR